MISNPVRVDTFISSAVLLLVVFTITLASYYVVEKPFRNSRTVSRSIFFGVTGIGLVALLTLAAVGLTNGYKDRYPSVLWPQSGFPVGIEIHKWFGNPSQATQRLIFVGDSHLNTLTPQAREMVIERGYAFANSSVAGCQLLVGTQRVNSKTNRPHPTCTLDKQAERIAFLESAPASTVLVGGRLDRTLQDSESEEKVGGREGQFGLIIQDSKLSLNTQDARNQLVRSSYTKTVGRLRAAGHKIVLVYPVPEVGFNLPEYLKTHLRGRYADAVEILTLEPLVTDHEAYLRRSRSAFALLDSIPGDDIIRIYPDRVFCNQLDKGLCATHDTRSLFYRDSHHLSREGAEKLLPVLFKVLDE